jgi:hypothetical protein
MLRPGEWIRVKANIRLKSQPACTSMTLLPGFWLRRNSVLATQQGIAWRGDNICVNETLITPITVPCQQVQDGPQK